MMPGIFSHPEEPLGLDQLAEIQGSERKKHREGSFHSGPLVFTFPTLLTRWQQLAVPGFSRAEDKAATRPVLEGGLAGTVMGADAGVPLVPREASTVATPLVGDTALCDRGKGDKK